MPGPGLPADAVVHEANNNLDATWHDGVLYLAWRTAPTHFASSKAIVQVLASDDGGHNWRLDYSVVARRDLREPRLVSWNGQLLLYWFTAGVKARKFQPDRIWVTQQVGPGRWRQPKAISPPGCVVWRVRPLADRLAMTVYRGAEQLFTATPEPLTVELWGSEDGWRWEPFDRAHPVVHRGGAEAEFIELADGRLLGVVRKEGPDGGWGSDIVSAPADELTAWTVRPDERKFDSPWLFLDRGNPFLVARRTLGQPRGRYDALGAVEELLDTELRIDPHRRTRLDQGLYWLTPKRTTLYSLDPDTCLASAVGDLPSAGDTAFAATVPVDGPGDGGGRHILFNYSSPRHHPWWPWVVGQLRPTRIEALDLTLL